MILLKIGDFAKICRVSPQTLRYYDAEGVLCAKAIDAQSGYRYYDPEQIRVYQRIVMLKNLGFSLAEIKTLLSAPQSELQRMYAMKKEALLGERHKLDECVSLLDALSGREGIPSLAYRAQSLAYPFVDDEEAVGKWQLSGMVSGYEEGMAFPDPKQAEPSPYPTVPILYFLPEGQCYWNFYWSKGLLFRACPRYQIILENEYRIEYNNGEAYMLIHWFGDECVAGEAESYYLLYHRLDRNRYREIDTHTVRDKVDLPFVPDPSLEGCWRAVACVPCGKAFDPRQQKQDAQTLFVRRMEIRPDGACIKTLCNQSGIFRQVYRYTSGAILDETRAFAEHYEFREIDGDRYLFVEHKSGDYAFLGKVYCCYVFQKESALS